MPTTNSGQSPGGLGGDFVTRSTSQSGRSSRLSMAPDLGQHAGHLHVGQRLALAGRPDQEVRPSGERFLARAEI
jgi:hypothetical protein